LNGHNYHVPLQTLHTIMKFVPVLARFGCPANKPDSQSSVNAITLSTAQTKSHAPAISAKLSRPVWECWPAKWPFRSQRWHMTPCYRSL